MPLIYLLCFTVVLQRFHPFSQETGRVSGLNNNLAQLSLKVRFRGLAQLWTNLGGKVVKQNWACVGV